MATQNPLPSSSPFERKARILGAILIVLGLGLAAGAIFAYTAAALPYPDPTQELLIEQSRDKGRALLALVAGAAMIAGGALGVRKGA